MNRLHFYRMSGRRSVLGILALTVLTAGCGRSEPTATPLDAATVKKHQQARADDLGAPVEITNTIGMKLVLIPAGEFVMGTSKEEISRLARIYPESNRELYQIEHPPHRVKISHAFYMGKYEVTVGQFWRFVKATAYKTEPEQDGKGGIGWDNSIGRAGGPDPKYTWRRTGFKQTKDQPVVNVTWDDGKAFCEWLSKTENRTYRLPTEAEWEYACRAGTTTQFDCGDDPEMLSTVSNVSDATAKDAWTKLPDWGYISSRDGYVFTAPVGRFQPNAFGLHDMHGNVSEFCQDWFSPDYYAHSPPSDPQGPERGIGFGRVLRGGSWSCVANLCRSADRGPFPPRTRGIDVGFRVAADRSGR